ncbi:MAG TPA: FkbM family methyltransferase [Stellaceae bacterium]|nr:FkbM family methyltransferase [Stellaceae bacterium]
MALAQLPVLKRLVRSLRKRRAELSAPAKYRLVKRDGAMFLVNYRDWADRMAIIHGLVERAQIDYLIGQIAARGCEVFLDIGAHMGSYAMMVALRTRCAKIVAIEPDPQNFAHLQANLLVNGLLDRVESRAVAITDSDGTVPFARSPQTHDVWSRISDASRAATMVVPAARLDSLLPLSGQAIALKIDIEEHELRALGGMSQLLRNNRCFMQVECFDAALPDFTAAMAVLGYAMIRSIGHDRYFAPRADTIPPR